MKSFIFVATFLSLLVSSCNKEPANFPTRKTDESARRKNVHSKSRTPGSNHPHDLKEITNVSALINRLASADKRWRPKVITMADGSKRYTYQKRLHEGTLTLEELKERIKNPSNFEAEKTGIAQLIKKLRSLGIPIFIGETHSVQAVGTWNPSSNRIILRQLLVDNGTPDFHEALSHEAIHVAQSCASGSINNKPRPLGLPLKYSVSIDEKVSHPLYAINFKDNLQIEREAYSHSREPGKARKLLDHYCN
ncbi:hypothetical protein [Prochlorococcus sp. MIT 1201]|uniref:hypothetical protein n=1 Tax=Prochlorococcus sp. MIT 1201 TaxID=3082535 RepID=UPI0039A40D91